MSGEPPVSATRLVVPVRLRGPSSSGNGGWVAGRLAEWLDRPAGTAVTVTLRRPPPLEVPLEVVVDADRALLVDPDGGLVAEAVAAPADPADHPDPADPGTPAIPQVPPVPFALARSAERAYGGLVAHPFPECFACGTARAPGDGLGLRPGRLGDGSERTACTWVPHASLAVDGAVPAAVVWAALDCPGGWSAHLEGRPMVLGRMTAVVLALPRVGEECVVMGWLRGAQGRKTWTASTAYGAGGRELGRAEATWISFG